MQEIHAEHWLLQSDKDENKIALTEGGLRTRNETHTVELSTVEGCSGDIKQAATRWFMSRAKFKETFGVEYTS